MCGTGIIACPLAQNSARTELVGQPWKSNVAIGPPSMAWAGRGADDARGRARRFLCLPAPRYSSGAKAQNCNATSRSMRGAWSGNTNYRCSPRAALGGLWH
jgi:hypothetical protein